MPYGGGGSGDGRGGGGPMRNRRETPKPDLTAPLPKVRDWPLERNQRTWVEGHFLGRLPGGPGNYYKLAFHAPEGADERYRKFQDEARYNSGGSQNESWSVQGAQLDKSMRLRFQVSWSPHFVDNKSVWWANNVVVVPNDSNNIMKKKENSANASDSPPANKARPPSPPSGPPGDENNNSSNNNLRNCGGSGRFPDWARKDSAPNTDWRATQQPQQQPQQPLPDSLKSIRAVFFGYNPHGTLIFHFKSCGQPCEALVKGGQLVPLKPTGNKKRQNPINPEKR